MGDVVAVDCLAHRLFTEVIIFENVCTSDQPRGVWGKLKVFLIEKTMVIVKENITVRNSSWLEQAATNFLRLEYNCGTWPMAYNSHYEFYISS